MLNKMLDSVIRRRMVFIDLSSNKHANAINSLSETLKKIIGAIIEILHVQYKEYNFF